MSAPKTIYIDIHVKSKFFRFLATPKDALGYDDFVCLPIDEDMPVYKLMDFIAEIK